MVELKCKVNEVVKKMFKESGEFKFDFRNNW